jgi:catechol 2,3-dioxygenase-like lactoylglutathione lyase family enzyme
MILEHVGMTVNDLERSIRFYTEVFGFALLRKTTTNAYLYLDDQLLELTQCRAPAQVTTPDSPEAWTEYMYGAPATIHIGFRVDDMDEAVRKIEELGGELVVPPCRFEPQIEHAVEATVEKLRRAAKPTSKPYWRLAVFADPDGIILELVER